jgi:inosine-uridine nucleoside N-ribohydrolase
VLTGWEISSKVWLREGDLAGLRAKKPTLGWVLDAAGDWLNFWKSNLGTDGFNPFDALAIGYGIDPKGFACSRLPMRIEQLPDDTVGGPSAPLKPYLLADSTIASKQTALYCSEAPARFRAEFLALLAN